MTRTPSRRRLARLEQALASAAPAPCFERVPDEATAERQVEHLEAEFGTTLPRTLFVMIGAATTEEPRA